MATRRFVKLRRTVVGFVAAACSLGAGLAFVNETTPYVPAKAPTFATFDDAQLAAWADFPDFEGAIPVLAYHDISEEPGEFAVTPERFAEHLHALRAAGFQTVSLAQVASVARGDDVQLPSRPVLLTFDDGPASNWTYADPILRENGFTAAAFLVTGVIADGSQSYYLNWDQIRDLHRSGIWEFAAHTHSGHRYVPVGPGETAPWLTNLERSATESETIDEWQRRVTADLDEAIGILESKLGSPATRALSYPFSAAEYPTNDPRIPDRIAAVVEARFDLAFTSGSRTTASVHSGSNITQLPRLTIKSATTGDDLLAAMAKMVPSPVTGALDGAAWRADGGSCSTIGATLVITADVYATCHPSLNTSTWADLTLGLRVNGADRDATAVVALRRSDEGRIEIAIGEDAVRVRQLVRDTWQPLATIALAPPADPLVPPSRSLSVSLTGNVLTLSVDATEPSMLTIDDALRLGGVSFSLAPRGQQSVELGELAISAHDAPGS